MCKAPARLIDISTNGAALLAARAAKPGDVLWLGIASLPWEWVKATIRGAFLVGSRGRYHIAFCEPCPVGLFEAAIGLSARSQAMPSFHIRWDDDLDENTCYTIPLL